MNFWGEHKFTWVFEDQRQPIVFILFQAKDDNPFIMKMKWLDEKANQDTLKSYSCPRSLIKSNVFESWAYFFGYLISCSNLMHHLFIICINFLYMFRAILCSSGGSIVYTQHLVLCMSLFLGDRSVHRQLEDFRRIYCIHTASGSVYVTLLRWPLSAQAVRGLYNRSSWWWAQYCLKHVEEYKKYNKQRVH